MRELPARHNTSFRVSDGQGAQSDVREGLPQAQAVLVHAQGWDKNTTRQERQAQWRATAQDAHFYLFVVSLVQMA